MKKIKATIQRRFRRLFERNLGRLLSFYPPYLGAGVRIAEVSSDFRYLRVEMPLRIYNQNYVGTHFGGSLYSMVDPFYMLMLLQNLGPGFVVWDKAASIDFKRPGRGVVWAEFELSEERLDEIREATEEGDKVEPVFHVTVRDEDGGVVAEVKKRLYVRRQRVGQN